MQVGCKNEGPTAPVVVKWFVTHSIAGAECLLFPHIPDYQRKVSLDTGQAVAAPHLIGSQNQLGIGSCPQDRAFAQEFAAQIFPVVYPAVHDQHQAFVLIG